MSGDRGTAAASQPQKSLPRLLRPAFAISSVKAMSARDYQTGWGLAAMHGAGERGRETLFWPLETDKPARDRNGQPVPAWDGNRESATVPGQVQLRPDGDP